MWRDSADELGILRPKTQLKLYTDTAQEFPVPFYSGPENHSGAMSRAERRRMERAARKMEKRKK